MFGVVGNISPQQIKFPPVCPPKMFATPLDCLLKSKLLESEERVINDILGNATEEKTSNIIDWFIHNDVPNKPKSNPSSASKRKRGKQLI